MTMAKVTGITRTKYCMDHWKILLVTDVNPLTPTDFTGCTLCEESEVLRFKATKAVKSGELLPTHKI